MYVSLSLSLSTVHTQTRIHKYIHMYLSLYSLSLSLARSLARSRARSLSTDAHVQGLGKPVMMHISRDFFICFNFNIHLYSLFFILHHTRDDAQIM
jgi:hypothetical protein